MVTVTDFNGCTGMASQSVTVNSLPIVGSIISPSSTVCYGTNVTLNGTGAVIYSWSDSIIDGTPFMAVASNLYTVIGTDSNGCTGMASQMVTVNSLPNVGSTALPSSTVCYGTNVSLNGTGAINYFWNNNIANGIPFMAVASNTYNVTGIDSNGCSNTSSIMITVNSLPIASIIAIGSTTFCNGGSVTLDAGAWSAYSWSDLTMSENDLITAGGNYMVTVTDFNGCTGMASQSVTVNPLPVVGCMASPS